MATAVSFAAAFAAIFFQKNRTKLFLSLARTGISRAIAHQCGVRPPCCGQSEIRSEIVRKSEMFETVKQRAGGKPAF